MTTYFFTIIESKTTRRMPYRKETAKVFKIVKNEPVFVCYVEWSTGMYRGAVHEVMNKLSEIKEIPHYYTGYYHPWAMKRKPRFKIIDLADI